MIGKVLCHFNYHKWSEIKQTLTVYDNMVFGGSSYTLQLKKCNRCGIWNIPRESLYAAYHELSNKQKDELDKVYNRAV